MAEAWRTRLRIRTDKLQECIVRATSLIREAHTGEEGQSIEETKLVTLKLKSAVDSYEKEFNTFTEKTNPSDSCIEECLQLQMRAEETLVVLGALISERQGGDSVQSTASGSKLPKLDLPSYAGDILKFHEFWDRFQSSVHERRLSDADKLSYLQSCLTGEAHKCIEGLSISNLNYKIAVDTLQKRFGKKEVLIDAHYSALNALPRAAESAKDCRNTLDAVEVHLRILQSLGENINSSHLRVTILGKFPERVLYQIGLLTSTDQTVSQLRKALENVINAMERSTIVPSTPVEIAIPQTSGSAAALSCISTNTNRGTGGQNRKRRYNERHGKDKKKHSSTDKGPSAEKRTKLSCIFCEGEHYNDACQNVNTMKERMDKLKERCFLCLRKGHMSSECKMKRKCFHCKQRHNRAICPQKLKHTAGTTKILTPNHTNTCKDTISLLTPSNTYLQTATVQLYNQENNLTCRALLDCGSQRSYLTSRTATKLNLKITGEDLLMIYTFGNNKPNEMSSQHANITIETKRGVRRTIQVNIVPYITDSIPSAPRMLKDIKVDLLADESLSEGIDLLIGNDYYFSFIRKDRIKIGDSFFLIDTDFGWLPSGVAADSSGSNRHPFSMVTYCQCQEPILPYMTLPDLPLREVDVKFLWTLENIGIADSPKTTREEEAVAHFNHSIQYENNRYQVKWPWIDYPPDLPTNFGLAYGRLKGLITRLDTTSIQEYSATIQEQLDTGVIEIIGSPSVPQTQVSPPVHYLPHHLVQQEGKRGRIVYDGSAKLKDQRSLNECLYRGPSMLEDLIALILKFRTKKVALTADVEKAFLQLGLQTPDRDATRFLWLKDPTKSISKDNLLHLRFCRVPFGVVSSPFLLTATIRYHLLKRDSEVLRNLADSIYVDNLCWGSNSTSEAIELYHITRTVFLELGMNIREWMSNDAEFMKTIPTEQWAKENQRVKLLGLLWYPDEDTLKLKLDSKTFNKENIGKPVTKREVLKTIASFYDPCGFASPLLLPAKLVLQELWKRKVKWESQIPEDLRQAWQTSLSQIMAAKDVVVPRYVGVADSAEVQYDLHCFSDASKNAYAAVVYLCVECQGQTKVEMIMSKLRITPLNDKDNLKIPRLELLGFLIGSRILKYVKDNLGLNIRRQFLWTDSVIVLSWMKSTKLLAPFVARRVSEIQQNVGVEWKYVNTDQNPADLATRSELWLTKKQLWFCGPTFLKEDKSFWPSLPTTEQPEPCGVAEALIQEALSIAVERLDVNDPEDLETKDNEKNNQEGGREPVGEVDASMVAKIKNVQQQHFPLEVTGKETHLTRNLGLFMDVDGILRCRGRLTHTDWSYDKKHPILLPKNSDFTRDIIRNTHEKNYHVGTPHTLSILRQQYWILQGRSQVQKVLRNCAQCIKHGGGPYKLPSTPALPLERVNFYAPFRFTGVDYFGPIMVNSTQDKRWVCLFTCLSVRAIHLELVKDLSADEFVLAMRRFTASRGVPAMMVSDNALHFKLTAEVLASPLCQDNKVQWKFIPQLAPWHGGFYERLVGIVKRCLRRSLEKHLLTEYQMLTVLKEVEAVVNTRPLTYVGTDQDHVLTPADFLSIGKCLAITASDDMRQVTVTKRDLVEGWRRGQRLMEEFRRMFTDQYLPSLRERYQHSHREPRVKSSRDPMIGDIVQIKGESKNRENWRVGKVVSLIRSADGECRVAQVQVGDKEFRRSISHLYPLEVDGDLRVEEPTSQSSSSNGKQFEAENTPMELDDPYMIDDSTVPVCQGEGDKPQAPLEPETDNIEDVGDNSCAPDTYEEEKDVSHEPNEENETTTRLPRKAAMRAREKIAEWTSQIMFILLHVPRGECREMSANSLS